MYKGWIGGYKYRYSSGTCSYIDSFVINKSAKNMDLALPKDNNIRVTKLASIVGDMYSWTEDIVDKYSKPPNAIIGFTKHIMFENCVFESKFEIGEPYKTASSCECSLTHPEFVCTMFLPDLWPMLHTMTFDATDPKKVKKYIEGKFTFVKKGSAISLVGVSDE